MTGQPEHVLIIGAGLGGVRTAEGLRTAGFQGRISLVGAETHAPYDRPPLSKQILTGQWEPGRAVLRSLDQLEDLGVRAHLGLAAVGLRPGEIELSDGSTLYGDATVVATGLVARRLPDQPAHVHTLRTLDDSLALRETLDGAGSLLIVGAGFIGAEVATAARARDIAVTVLEALPVPSVGPLGPAVGALAGRLLTESGVDLRVDTAPTGFVEDSAPVAVRLPDGSVLTADAGLVGIGGAPRLDWLRSAPAPAYDPTPGLRCDPRGRVRGWDAVWAVGDVALWEDPVDGTARRHEHWTSAGDQAAVVARDILGAAPPPPAVPYFWSDQFGLKIQLIGRTEGADEILPLHGSGLDGGPVRGTVAGYLVGDRLVAVVGFGTPRHVARYRALVADRAARADVLARAAELGP
jgi:3-phenylpropionate/trans-cinnamate dioxygenase ferredoxin reductase subunit